MPIFNQKLLCIPIHTTIFIKLNMIIKGFQEF